MGGPRTAGVVCFGRGSGEQGGGEWQPACKWCGPLWRWQAMAAGALTTSVLAEPASQSPTPGQPLQTRPLLKRPAPAPPCHPRGMAEEDDYDGDGFEGDALTQEVSTMVARGLRELEVGAGGRTLDMGLA